jgi:hypothetical protein
VTVVFEGQGHWWLPENKDKQDKHVPGSISYDSDAGGELSLIGALSHWTEFAEPVPTPGGGIRLDHTAEIEKRSGNYPLIHGEVDSHSVTLEDCFQSHFSENLFNAAGSRERVYVNRLYKDVWWPDKPAANALVFSMAYLDDWVVEEYVGERHHFNEEEGTYTKFELDVAKRDKRCVSLEDGVEFTLKHHIGTGGRRSTQRHLAQGYTVRIDLPEAKPVDDALDIASDFQDLVSIATGRDAAFQDLWGFHPDLVRPGRGATEGEGSEGVPTSYQIFARWNIQDRAAKPNQIEHHELYFTLEHLGGMDGIANWMKAATTYRSTLGRTMGTRAAQGMYMSDRLLNYAAALEGFDRKKSGIDKQDLPIRLRRRAKQAGEPFKRLVGHVNKWVDLFVWHRNDIAHHLGRKPRGSAAEQHYLAESGYWLAVFLMLREAGAPEALFDRIAQHQPVQWLSRELRPIVASS